MRESRAGSIARRGGLTLLFAKFVPGVSTIAAPIAGQAGMSYHEFVVYDMAGTLVWAATWLFAGRFFGDIARRSNKLFATLTHFAVALVLLMILGMIIYRYVQRQRFLAELRGLRLEPDQLLAMMDEARSEGAQSPFIIDLRHPLDVLTDPEVAAGCAAHRAGRAEAASR